jgi:hypothetical protein
LANNALKLTSSQDYQGIVRTHSSRLQLSFIRYAQQVLA